MSSDRQDELQEHACNLIPEMVVVVNDWIKSQSPAVTGANDLDRFDAANSNAVPAPSTKVGWNEPCPCRSGRQYKRCCGGN